MSAPATKSFQRALTTAGEFARLETFLRRELYGLLQYKESHEGDEGGCDKKWVVEPSQEFWRGNGTKVQSVSVSDLSKVDGTAKGIICLRGAAGYAVATPPKFKVMRIFCLPKIFSWHQPISV